MKRYEQVGGWTLIPARLESGQWWKDSNCWRLDRNQVSLLGPQQWIAVAEHEDGRTLYCAVPDSAGPIEAETGLRAMLP